MPSTSNRRALPEFALLRSLDPATRREKLRNFVLAPNFPRRAYQKLMTMVRAPKTGAPVKRRLPVCRSFPEAIDRNFTELTDLLEHAGIQYWVVDDELPTRLQVGVHLDDRQRLLDAFLAHAAPGAVIAAPPSTDRVRIVKQRTGTQMSPMLRYRLTNAPTWVFFRYYSVGGSPQSLGVRYACVISLWKRPDRRVSQSDESSAVVRAPALLSATPNAVTQVLTTNDVDESVVEVAGRRHPTLAGFEGASLLDTVDFPIDLVYLWVDGTDGEWQARRDTTWHALHPDAPKGAGLASHLYRNRDELRYSLRSVEMFAPFVRTIYLVTDDQTPQWLDPENPRVKVVPHRALFDAGDVPTFNSNAIDTRLHRIDGLSEHFLVTNDDIFFVGPTFASDFFTSNGLPRLFLSRAQVPLGDAEPLDVAVDAAAKNNRQLLLERFGRRVTQKYKHIPIPQLRSVRLEVEDEFGGPVRSTASHRFRDSGDIAFSHLVEYYAYFTGRAVLGSLPYDYVHLADWRLVRRLDALIELAEKLKVLCLNDGDSYDVTDAYGEVVTSMDVDEATRDATVAEFLTTLFPMPSLFERRITDDRAVAEAPATAEHPA
jgi:hypothetical protein